MQMELKRGMVFFLEQVGDFQPVKCIDEHTYTKKRPYMIVSNNKCNEFSPLIHVVPIVTREGSPERYYQVPFTSVGNRKCIADVSQVMLIPKDLCNSVSYSESITKYTINNKDLISGIDDAIMRQFQIDTISTPLKKDLENVYTKAVTEEVKIETPKPIKEETMTIPNITLNININGVPVNMTEVSTTQTGDSCNIDISTVTTIEDNLKPAKKKKEIKRKTWNRTSKSPYSLEEKKKYIKENYVEFGGTLSQHQIAKYLKCATSNVFYWVDKLKQNENIKVKSNTKSTKRHKYDFPKEVKKKLMEDYDVFGADYVLENYKDCKFPNKKALVNYIYREKLTKRSK